MCNHKEEAMTKQIVTHLWYDNDAEEAAKFYTSVFKDGKIGDTTLYPKSAEVVGADGRTSTVETEILAFLGEL